MRESRLLRVGSYILNLDLGPRIMGILNVTPDSFSDGGLYSDPARAEEHALRLESEGASIIDVGGESSRPGSMPISSSEELKRVTPVLKRIINKIKIPISVDTYKYDVVERVLDLGVSIVNDIYGINEDPRISKLIGKYEAAVVLMHMRGNPGNMQHNVDYDDLGKSVEENLKAAAERALNDGVNRDSIIIDPGVGFGKSAVGNCSLVKLVQGLKERLKYPVLLGVSRKSFLKKILGDSVNMDHANAAMHAFGLSNGADILRVHDVAKAQEVITLYKHIYCENLI